MFDHLEELVNEINAFADSESSRALDTNSTDADFVRELGYGDAKLDFSYLTDDEVANALKALDRSQLVGLIDGLTEVHQVGIYRVDDEIYSQVIGEPEVELPESIQDQIDALSENEFNYMLRTIEPYYRGGNIYLNHNYDRFVLTLDTEAVRCRLGLDK
jgi:hypothetical protein